jgi:MFS family permease
MTAAAQRPWRWFDNLTVNAYWLGINVAAGILTPVLLPYLVALFAPDAQKNSVLAAVRVAGLAVAMLVQPLAGMLSDRSTLRWGRRRPFIATGALFSALFLIPIALSSRYAAAPIAALALLVGGVMLLQASSNLAQGALQGLIPDVVPEDRRGRASGVKAVFELLPILLVIFVGPLVDAGRVWLVVSIIAAGYLITMLVTVLFTHETPLAEKLAGSLREPTLRIVALTALFVLVTQGAVWLVRAAGSALAAAGAALPLQVVLIGAAGLAAMAGAIFIGVYYGAQIGIGPEAKAHKSFIWWVINRLLFLAAVGSVQGFAQFYMKDVLGIPNAATMTTVLLAVVAVFLLPAALGGGYLADRYGRKRLVGLGGLIAAAGTFVLLFARGVPLLLAGGSVVGLGTGLFMATNWALGTDLAPKKEAGLYLGISNLAGAGAGIVGAGIGGPLADSFNALRPGLGYTVIYAIYAALFLLSVLALRRVTVTPSPSS